MRVINAMVWIHNGVRFADQVVVVVEWRSAVDQVI